MLVRWALKLNGISENNHLVYVSLGSNINPEENLPRAIRMLGKCVSILQVSNVWETQAFGSSGPNFLNAVILIRTDSESDSLKKYIFRNVELKLGRIRTKDKNAPRTIDVDILIYDDQLLDTEICERAHLAVPLSELLPDYTCPTCQKNLLTTAKDLARLTPIYQRRDIHVTY